ncbi:MAG: GNAT family N-acetyltransferase [Prevotellaceae bacterium]|nr:GNAT family N-acetyltransferase [Prevotellaceae bacterium]
MKTNAYIIRKADISDLERLTEIYNQAIDANYCTCDTKHFTPHERLPWYEEHQDERCPIFVCVHDEDAIGYSYISSYRSGRGALSEVGEISYYVDFCYHGFGIAKRLIEHTLQAAKGSGYKNLLAILLDCNRESISLLKKYKFEEWGVLPKVAKLGEKYHSHLYYGLKL